MFGIIKVRKVCISQNTTSLVLYSFIYSKVTTCCGPYPGPSSGHKMNSLRKLYSVIYKMLIICCYIVVILQYYQFFKHWLLLLSIENDRSR